MRASGWETRIYLSRPEGRSAKIARELGFAPALPLSSLSEVETGALVAMLCPDSEIAPVYRDYLSGLAKPLTLVLAHGYAVYSGELTTLKPGHSLALLAPKAIGPKIWQHYEQGLPHRLVAGFHAPEPPAAGATVHELAQAMGFASGNLVPVSFEKEAVGDLLSEQGLLCGGVFTLLEWTLEEMKRAGVPPRLIREECLTELELIAGLLRERGPGETLRSISQAAQAGTIAMRDALEASGARESWKATLERVLDRRFADDFRSGRWREPAARLASRFDEWEKELKP